MIELDDTHFIGKGACRACYRHPADPSRCIKIDACPPMGPTTKEARYYEVLARLRPELDYSYIPRFHGFVETSRGRGGVFDLITDEGTGALSKLFVHCIEEGLVSADDPRWIAAHRTFLDKIFSDCTIVRDLHVRNFCARAMRDGSVQLVAIDGIGHRDFIPVCNYWNWAARRKLRRQVERKQFGSLADILHRYHSRKSARLRGSAALESSGARGK